MPFLPSFDEQTTQLHVFKRWPEITEPLGKLTQQILRDGPFGTGEAELMFAYISGVNACQYCFNIHRQLAAIHGINEELLEALLDDIDTAPIDDNLKPVMYYIKKLTLSPAKIIQKDVDKILEAGWDETAFHYIVSLCALTNYYNRVLDGHGIIANSVRWKESAERLSKTKYDEPI